MTTSRLTILAGMTCMILLSSCGGGGGGGGPFDLLDIQVAGTGGAIFVKDGPQSAGCPTGAFVNARVTFRFNAPVDPSTLPPVGTAAGGSIEILDVQNQQPAQGVFRVDPSNPRLVHFEATAPSDPQQPCAAGFAADTEYSVIVHGMDGMATSMILAGGAAIPTTVSACFTVKSCPGSSPYFDPVPTAPAVVATTPLMSGTAPLTLQSDLTGATGGSQITLDFDQALDPATVNVNTVSLLNTTANPQGPVPQAFTVTFFQAGSLSDPLRSRIVLNTQLPLADGDVFQVVLNGVTDLNGDAASSSDLLFTIQDNNDPVTQVFQESFDSTANRASTQGAVLWDGSGALNAVFVGDLLGDGSDGVGVFDTSLVINTDQLPVNHPGVFNFTSLTVGDMLNLGVTLQFTGTTDQPPGESNRPAITRCQGAILIHDGVVVDCGGRPGVNGGTAPPSSTSSRLGGWGGPGAGRGGTSSPMTDGTPSPMGLPGEGGRVDAMAPTRPGDQPNTDTANPLYGGGGGGAMALEPNFLLAAAGGGGGRASSFGGYDANNPAPASTFSFNVAQPGETHQGTDGMGLGAPPAGQPGPFPAAMIPPLREAVGGSGGGAGGDRVTVVSNVGTHIPGGSGGGGGGAMEFSCLGPLTIGIGVIFDCSGGAGGSTGGVFAGRGGGGSGGSMVIRSLSDLNLGLGITFDASGGATNRDAALNGDGGAGGDGVIQIESAEGTTSASLAMLFAIVKGELSTGLPLGLMDPGANLYGGTAISSPIDTGSSATDYTSASAVIDLGTVSGGVVSVELVGIAEDPAQPGVPATVAMTAEGVPLMTAPVALSDVDQLDGYRFFQIRVTIGFDPPPLSSMTDVFPSVEEVTVQYEQ